MTLSEAQRRTVLDAAFEVRVGARDWMSFGCMSLVFALSAVVLLRALPAGMRERLGAAVVVLPAGLLVFGLALWLFGRTIALARSGRRVDAAVETLTGDAGRGSDPALRAAVSLLLDAHHSPGPYTSETFVSEEMARRLGAALPLVIEVEEVLIGEGRIYPVFTSVPPADG